MISIHSTIGVRHFGRLFLGFVFGLSLHTSFVAADADATANDAAAKTAVAERIAKVRHDLQSPDAAVRHMAISSLIHSDLSAAMFADMQAALKDKDGKVREAAATATGNLGAAAVTAVPALVAQLKQDSVKEARETAARALGRIGKAAPKERSMREQLRASAANDTDAVTRVVSLGALYMLDDEMPEQIILSIRKHLHHAEPLVRMKAAHALGMIGAPAKAAAPEIVKVLEQEPDAHRRGYVARALGLTGDPASLPALYAALKKETDPGSQGEMRGAISRLGGKVPEQK